jgi:hypothetical protein
MNKQRLLELAGVVDAPYRAGSGKSGMLTEMADESRLSPAAARRLEGLKQLVAESGISGAGENPTLQQILGHFIDGNELNVETHPEDSELIDLFHDLP